MKFVTIRDLRNKPAQVRETLNKEKDLVLTSNGRPFAVMTTTSEERLEKTLAMVRQIRAEMAVASMQKRSIAKDTDKLSLEEINAEINTVRRKNSR